MKALSVFKMLACLAKDRVPGQLVIQITNQCNAACPQCGMRIFQRPDPTRIFLPNPVCSSDKNPGNETR